MLDHRKFYYPLAYSDGRYEDEPHKSPWQAASVEIVIAMDSDNAYVGEHSPRITLRGPMPRGLMQDGLALRQGQAYTSRLVLRGSSTASVEVSLIWGTAPNDWDTISIEPLGAGYATTQSQFAAGGGIPTTVGWRSPAGAKAISLSAPSR